MERNRVLHTGLAVIVMDLDHFKPFHDRHGDAVLREVEKSL